MRKYTKALVAVAAAVAATIAWRIDPSTVPAGVVAGAWLAAAGVFGLKNA